MRVFFASYNAVPYNNNIFDLWENAHKDKMSIKKRRRKTKGKNESAIMAAGREAKTQGLVF
jgi:hypothetical protein